MRNRHLFSAVLLVSGLMMFSTSAHAGPRSDALGQCLVQKSTDNDHLVLVRWMFSAMVQHPELAQLSKLSESDRERIDADVAKLFQRLITEDCRAEARSVVQEEGMIAFQSSFEVFGKVAAQAIFGHSAVNAAMGGLQKHLDGEVLSKALMSED